MTPTESLILWTARKFQHAHPANPWTIWQGDKFIGHAHDETEAKSICHHHNEQVQAIVSDRTP